MPLLTNGECFRVKKRIAEIDENIMREKVKEEEIGISRKNDFFAHSFSTTSFPNIKIDHKIYPS